MRPLSPSDEAQLLYRVSLGDQKAFAELFYSYHQLLGGYIFALTKSHTLTEEIVQDSFLKIWQQRTKLPAIQSFKAYLFTISKHHTLNTMRNELHKAKKFHDWVNDQQTITTCEEPLDRYIILDQAIDQLPTQQRKTWLLSKHQGLKQDEIAQHLQLSKETVKRHLSLANASITRFIRLKSTSLSLFIVSFLI